MKKNQSIKESVRRADDAKKVNPLDLSSDQDLSIALMNLISIEEHFVFSGAKTQKTGFYDLVDVVRDMRARLMAQIVTTPGAAMDVSRRLLAASMRLIEVGTKALTAGNSTTAYKLFDDAYELYSLFWGVNMGLIDLKDVSEIAPGCQLPDDGGADRDKQTTSESRTMVQKLGAWVKGAVNCCIE